MDKSIEKENLLCKLFDHKLDPMILRDINSKKRIQFCKRCGKQIEIKEIKTHLS